MKLYAIGDIHGCYQELTKLLVKIGEDKGDDEATIVFLGDYVDRGPDSEGVIDLLIGLQNHSKREGAKTKYVFLRGNHEDMMLSPDARRFSGIWLHNGGYQTLESYGGDAIDEKKLESHMKWIEENTVIWHREAEFFFVHAGISPELPLEHQSEDTMLWSRGWNSYEGEYPENVFVVHGHTPYPTPEIHTNQLNIDTGCVFGKDHDAYGRLTAVRLDGRLPSQMTFFQVKLGE